MRLLVTTLLLTVHISNIIAQESYAELNRMLDLYEVPKEKSNKELFADYYQEAQQRQEQKKVLQRLKELAKTNPAMAQLMLNNLRNGSSLEYMEKLKQGQGLRNQEQNQYK